MMCTGCPPALRDIFNFILLWHDISLFVLKPESAVKQLTLIASNAVVTDIRKMSPEEVLI